MVGFVVPGVLVGNVASGVEIEHTERTSADAGVVHCGTGIWAVDQLCFTGAPEQREYALIVVATYSVGESVQQSSSVVCRCAVCRVVDLAECLQCVKEVAQRNRRAVGEGAIEVVRVEHARIVNVDASGVQRLFDADEIAVVQCHGVCSSGCRFTCVFLSATDVGTAFGRAVICGQVMCELRDTLWRINGLSYRERRTRSMTTATASMQRKVVTTAQLQQLLAEGKKVMLPPVDLPASLRDTMDTDDVVTAAQYREVVSVTQTSREPVQCIAVDDPRHLYVTDGFVATHNTSNIIYLKSTDDSMIETLTKMSGTTHRVYRDSKTVTRDVEKLMLQVEGKVSYTSTAKEEAVITYNDLAYLPERNSIVFRAGDQPIWNRNETILPMSWRLFMNKIEHYGHEDYTLQTIPTLSTAIDFDVRQNQPDFGLMLETRLEQASYVETAAETFAKAYGYSAFDIERLDPDVYADEVLDIVRMLMGESIVLQKDSGADDDRFDDDDMFGDEGESTSAGTIDMRNRPEVADDFGVSMEEKEAQRAERARAMEASATNNTELETELADNERKRAEGDKRLYADGMLSKNMLHDVASGEIMTSYDKALVMAYLECKAAFHADPKFTVDGDGNLRGKDGTSFITVNGTVQRAQEQNAQDAEMLDASAQDPDARVYAEDAMERDAYDVAESDLYTVHVAFKKYLCTFDDWNDIAGGRFNAEVARAIKIRNDASGNHDGK